MTDPAREYDDLLAKFVDRLLDGESLDCDAILAAHPESGTRLVEDLRSFIDPDSEPGSAPADVALGTLGCPGAAVFFVAHCDGILRPVSPEAARSESKLCLKTIPNYPARGRLCHSTAATGGGRDIERGFR